MNYFKFIVFLVLGFYFYPSLADYKTYEILERFKCEINFPEDGYIIIVDTLKSDNAKSNYQGIFDSISELNDLLSGKHKDENLQIFTEIMIDKKNKLIFTAYKDGYEEAKEILALSDVIANDNGTLISSGFSFYKHKLKSKEILISLGNLTLILKKNINKNNLSVILNFRFHPLSINQKIIFPVLGSCEKTK